MTKKKQIRKFTKNSQINYIRTIFAENSVWVLKLFIKIKILKFKNVIIKILPLILSGTNFKNNKSVTT